MPKKLETSLVIPATVSFIERRIFMIRSHKVILSTDLAELYQVEPRVLIQAVKRNRERFPEDFMFQLNPDEALTLKSQSVISNERRGGNRHAPYAFTEPGVAMLSSVLNSSRAVQMNIYIIRAFVKLRELLASHADLAQKIGELEKGQKEHTESLIVISTALSKLSKEFKDTQNKRPPAIGFQI